MNNKIKEARLKKDNYECQLSKLFGITEISGSPCSDDLEQHHKTYVRCGHEDINDIITVCTRCHDILTDAIRRERYATKPLENSKMITGLCAELKPNNDKIKIRRIHNVRKDSISMDRDCSVEDAQSKISKPTRYFCKGY